MALTLRVAGMSLLLVAVSGCAVAPPPVLTALREREQRTPVVLVPGMTGTALRDRRTNAVVWGRTRNLFRPRDRGHALALPVAGDAGPDEGLEPAGPILKLGLLGFSKPIYGPLRTLMEQNGYRTGRLEDPHSAETLFLFSYDWRRESVEAARELARQLERLRVARGDDVLHVSLICQSNAALICRYLTRYGGADLDAAESGAARGAPRLRVDKLLLVGTANGGAMRVLHEMNHGRRYVGVLGRRWAPETLFSFPALYEGLPVYRERFFFDASGNELDVDPFAAESWLRYGWSIFAPRVARRLDRGDAGTIFGDAESRRAFLERALDRARRLHRLLRADPPGFVAPRIYLLQDGYARTPDRALLVEEAGGWRTHFQDARQVRREPYLRALASAPGDGHATLDSQLWLSPAERTALARPPVYVEGGHFEVILNAAAQRFLLEFLDE